MSTPVIYEMDSIGENEALEAVGTHVFCSTSCRDAHTGKILGPTKIGESDMDFIGLLCEECGKAIASYSGPCETCPHCGGSGKIPTPGKPLHEPKISI